MNIRKDDTVYVISGDERGKKGKVLRTEPKTGKVVVEGINFVTKHNRPRRQSDPGGIIKVEAPLYASKVMLVCPKCGKNTRVGYKFLADKSKVRVCKKCGDTI